MTVYTLEVRMTSQGLKWFDKKPGLLVQTGEKSLTLEAGEYGPGTVLTIRDKGNQDAGSSNLVEEEAS